ncbi:DUF4150 domain-containing protein [Corallococcus sp. M34]|uniref:DUF4150 domain-containing protein n=1 Tax=Citreicoccus inhibens TaxID=2849499 RepID=UPI001C24B0A3|nr:DUF4150 domain-containing protein [Citreicoccus inhibens]MBU8895144.1 DUF4150 domain-containing protein [Citreicoccus inhibens]
MSTVAIHPPKTPVTLGSDGVAAATLPNVCKMPGPPAPFVPTPLPNVGRSNDSPKGYSKSVTIDGHAVAIQGASFGSQGDIASKGTGGGMVSANTQGPTRFVGPGSMSVKIEGKNVQLLGDPMLNNCGPGGSPPNAATMAGEMQAAKMVAGSCTHPQIRREPALGTETRSSEELAKSLDDEANRLDKLADEKMIEAMQEVDMARSADLKRRAAHTRDGAKDKRFEARVARDTKAKEVSVKVCCSVCGKILAEFDVVTANGTYKEVKESGQAVKVGQFYKERELARDPLVAPFGTVVHLAVPGDGKQRGEALKRFVRSGGRKMTNKGAGYDRVIQEH